MNAVDLALILGAHAIGDYLAQSDWMAQNKTSRWIPAVLHAVTYTLAYVVVTRSILALAVIGGTHLIIDRYRLIRYIVFAKNCLAPRSAWPTWEDSKGTGYPSKTPPFLAVWLMIIADNTLHLIINVLSFIYL
jgi:hypothetical protein